jgi:cell division protease FtsH
MTRAELENKMATLLGGRAAEHLVFGEVSTGAADDLQKVTSTARSIVMRFGMHEKLGNVVYSDERPSFLGAPVPNTYERIFSEETAREIDCAVREIVAAAFDRTVGLLSERRQVLETGARLLLEKETLTQDDIRSLSEARSAVAAAN